MTTKRRTAKAAPFPSEDVAKALVSVPAPARANKFYIIGGGTEKEVVIDPSKRDRHSIYYEMYRQHPVLRAGIEKIAKVAVANGYAFVPETPDLDINKDRAKVLRTFFRRSNGSQLLRLTYKDLLIYGEAYWLIVGAKNGGVPQRAMRLHPMYMDADIRQGVVTRWRYGPLYQTEEAIPYALNEVLHFKLDDPNSDVYGLSILDSLQHTVASDLFAMKFNRKFFENAAQVGLIFNMKNSSSDEVARNREWLEQNYTGAENAHRPLILEGDIDVKQSVSKMQEMQFIEGRKLNRQEILSALDIDPSKLGINEDVNRSSSKEADNTFRQETVAPLQLVVEEEINNALILGMFGWDDILFRQGEVSKRDLLDSMKLFAEAERMGVMNINEIRGELGLPDIDGGDQHFVQTAAGLIPLSLLDDVAMRLVTAPQLAPTSGMGTDNAPIEDDEQDEQDVTNE